MALQPPPVGWVRVYSQDPPLSVTARLSDEQPVIEQGFGGWDEVTRPRRSPLTTFKAPPGLHLTLPLMFDRFATDTSVERDLATLQRMGQPTAADGEPPRVRVNARGGAIPYQARTWVINDITYGAAEMNHAGDRTRQQVTLGLIEYVEDVHLVEKSAATRRRSKSKATKRKRGASTKRTVVVRKPHVAVKTRTADTAVSTGEPLSRIAARELGDANRWPEIAKLNNLRDPNYVKAGQVLRLP